MISYESLNELKECLDRAYNVQGRRNFHNDLGQTVGYIMEEYSYLIKEDKTQKNCIILLLAKLIIENDNSIHLHQYDLTMRAVDETICEYETFDLDENEKQEIYDIALFVRAKIEDCCLEKYSRVVFNLIMTDREISDDKHSADFNIGFFSKQLEAIWTAKRYLAEVEGFKDYDVTYKITNKNVIGIDESFELTEIFIVYGWNENDELDAVDIIESNAYATKQAAEKKLNELKASFERKEWCVDRFKIDECRWQDGFVRVNY